MSDAIERFRNFKAPGPVAAAFLSDRESIFRSLRGPVGGGKTVTTIFDSLGNASLMPVCRDGEIHFRYAVIGSTYGQLERNLYPTWQYWLPADGGNWTEAEWTGGGGRFAKHKIEWDILRNMPGGTRRVKVNYEAIFAAIGEQALEEFMRGFEPTAWELFELDQLPEGIIENAIGRLGRWPNKDMLPDGVDYRGYVVGDLNSPDVDSWYYTTIEERRPKGWKAYVQPSGLSPRAENLQNLPKGYYQRLAETNAHKQKWVKRFVLNEYGPSDDGKPVYTEYSDEIFLAPDELLPVRGIPIEIGADAGLGNPAVIIGQAMPDGQFRPLGEVVPGRMSAKRVADQVKAELMDLSGIAGFPLELSCGWCDPAGFNGADNEDNERAWAEQLALALGIPIEPTETNAILPRLDAVRDNLVTIGAKPMLWVSRRCKKLRKGFASSYCYKVDKKSGEPGADAKPAKGPYSHPHDALQYWMLGKKGLGAIVGAAAPHAPGQPHRGIARAPAHAGTVIVKSNTLSSS